MAEKRVLAYKKLQSPHVFVSESDFLIALVENNEYKKKISNLRTYNNY